MESLNNKLFSAAVEGNNQSVEEFLKHGAQVNCKNETGWTALHLASFYGKVDTVELLLSKGAVVNLLDKWRYTPLHRAAQRGHKETVIKLISKGAVIDSKNNEGKTPYYVATDEIRELIDRIRKKGVRKIEIETVLYQRKDPSAMLTRLLGEGSYESYDMRIMVTGQFGVGKTCLVRILVGENVSNVRQSTDGISLLEGRCGLDIKWKKWILLDKDDYNALDFVYSKMLMSSEESKVNQKLALPPINPPKTKRPEKHREHGSGAIPKKPVQYRKMTKEVIRQKMIQIIESGKYKTKIGRLMFWDFGGQYVYYTTHQTFMSYRALFLVVFDGSKSIFEKVDDMVFFPGQHDTPTAAAFLTHWVNSILTYCKVIHQGIPKILFIGTHKDKVPEALVEKKRTSMYHDIDKLFRDHEGRHHLVWKDRLFINATNKDDPEISTLKDVITKLTFEHPCWGERKPNTWILLELEIAELAATGKKILLLEEVKDLNKASEVSVLSEEDLKFFLQFQHSIGKIVYFDTPKLREFVIISPVFMVEVMRSFVTDKQFWPKREREMITFQIMSRYGLIKKNDLFAIWEQPEFAQILTHKEFVLDMLVHLDILSEQRRYDVTTGSLQHVENFFVPCMLKKINTTNYIENECIPSRAIGLAFVFRGTIIPPALPNRLISACLSMWSVKDYKREKLMFSGFVVLSLDKLHDLVVCVQSERIVVYVIHNSSKGLIVSDIATGVRECLHASLRKISEFYQSTVCHETSDNECFHVELACSDLKCYVLETKALKDKTLRCQEHKKTFEVKAWYQEESQYTCSRECRGLSLVDLCKTPSDHELLRLSSKLDHVEARELAIHLGMEDMHWQEIDYDNSRNIARAKFLMLIKWRNSLDGKFTNIYQTLSSIGRSRHLLCQVMRKNKKRTDIPAEYLGAVPTDEILDALAPQIATSSLQLGIELGLKAEEILVIEYDNKNDIVAQTRKILYKWRNNISVHATLDILHQALVNVGRGAECLKNIVDKLGVKKHDFLQNQ